VIFPTESLENLIMDGVADVGKALASPIRLRVIRLLSQSERSVEGLAASLDISVANLSQHLQVLKRSGFLNSRRDGRRVYYQVSNRGVMVVSLALAKWAEGRSDVGSSLYSFMAKSTSISRAELVEGLKVGKITVIDVRHPEEFAVDCVPGAINIPSHELERRVGEVPADRDVVICGQGLYSPDASQALSMLSGLKLNVRYLDGGYMAWCAGVADDA